MSYFSSVLVNGLFSSVIVSLMMKLIDNVVLVMVLIVLGFLVFYVCLISIVVLDLSLMMKVMKKNRIGKNVDIVVSVFMLSMCLI